MLNGLIEEFEATTNQCLLLWRHHAGFCLEDVQHSEHRKIKGIMSLTKTPKARWGFTTFVEVAGETWHILSSPCLQKTDWQLIFPPSVHKLQNCGSRKETAQVDKQIWQGKKRKKRGKRGKKKKEKNLSQQIPNRALLQCSSSSPSFFAQLCTIFF